MQADVYKRQILFTIRKGEIMKQIVKILCAVILTASVFCIPVCAANGDVASAIEETWGAASEQIKAVVNNVVFPAIDLVLAVFFFAKLGTCLLYTSPAWGNSLRVSPPFTGPACCLSLIHIYNVIFKK